MVKLENNENDNEETSNKPDNDIPHDPYFPPIVSLPEVEVKMGKKTLKVWIVFCMNYIFSNIFSLKP